MPPTKQSKTDRFNHTQSRKLADWKQSASFLSLAWPPSGLFAGNCLVGKSNYEREQGTFRMERMWLGDINFVVHAFSNFMRNCLNNWLIPRVWWEDSGMNRSNKRENVSFLELI